jgi:hypothetical protein
MMIVKGLIASYKQAKHAAYMAMYGRTENMVLAKYIHALSKYRLGYRLRRWEQNNLKSRIQHRLQTKDYTCYLPKVRYRCARPRYRYHLVTVRDFNGNTFWM